MNSYQHLIGRAILSSDPAERQAAEDAVTVKLYASKLLQDQADTVVIEAPGYAPYVLTGARWEAALAGNPDLLTTFASQGARILDGRVLFAKPARRPRATRAKPAFEREAAKSGPPPAYIGIQPDAPVSTGCAHLNGHACPDCL